MLPSFADILLVRHGESEANATGRFACRTWDPALTETGRSQALELARYWHNAPVRYLVTSPLLRAQQTVAPLAQDHALTPVILPDLAEVNLGQWDGQRLIDLEAAESPPFLAWRQDPDRNPPPGGESIRAVGHRVLNTLAAFARPRERNTLTVATTHADCIKGAVMVIMNAEGPVARRLIVPNAGHVLLRWFDTDVWTVMLSSPEHEL